MFIYERDSNVFEKIDSEEKAYWLGFLYADGYVNEIDNVISMGLAEQDNEHILKFRNFLKTDAPYKDRINNKNKPYRFFRIYDQKIVNDLYNQGLYHNKSKTIKPKMIMPDELLIHWSRGLFDGDGSIYPVKNSVNSIKYRINLTGAKDILLFIQNIWGVNKKLDEYCSVPKFVIAGKSEAKMVLEKMYNNATIYLDRKYELAIKAIEINSF